MADFVAGSNVHALVAFVFTALLLRRWRSVDPGARIWYWGGVLAGTLALHPVLFFLPLRRDDAFRQEWALLDLSRWKSVAVGPVSAWGVLVAAAVATGVALLLRDAVPLVAERMEERVHRRYGTGTTVAALEAEVSTLSSLLGIRPPRVALLDDPGAVLHCENPFAPVLLVSEGTLSLLDAEERRAALAHELAHVKAGDLFASWALLCIRVLLFFNPVVQLASRKWLEEVERRADEVAAHATGAPLPLASALLKLFKATGGGHGGSSDLPGEGWLPEVFHRAESLGVTRRARLLVDRGTEGADPVPRLRFALTGATVTAILILVL